MTLTANTASSATNNGTLVVTGGVGISGAINVGSASSIGGVLSLTANTASSATNNGTLVVSGGVGISGALNVGGTITGGLSSSSATITGGSINGTTIGATTRSTGAFSGLTVVGTTTVQQTSELFQTLTNATGTVTHNWANGAIFYHTSPAADFTANFTNVPTTNNYSHSVALVIVQGATARRPTGVSIAGAVQTINWANNTIPTGVANRTQVFNFTLIRAAGTWRVLGSAQSF